MADVFGIIAPHPPIMVAEVGRARSDATTASARAMERVAGMLAAFAPDTVVVMSPHAPAVADAFAVDTSASYVGDLGDFGASQLTFRYDGDPELASAILGEAERAGLPAVDRASIPRLSPGLLDHGVMVPMSFLDREGVRPLVGLSITYLPLEAHRRFGAAVASAAERLGRRIAFLASGDCSHRLSPEAPAGYSPRGAVFDEELVRRVRAGDLEGLVRLDQGLVESAGECGLRSFVTLGGLVPDPAARVLAYEGPWGVGYMTAVVAPSAVLDGLLAGATPETGTSGGGAGTAEGTLPALARRAIETFVREGRMIDAPALTEEGVPERAGVFVSLHLDGILRGCIGTICATQDTLGDEVVHNAIQAATADPRFPPMTPSELDGLDVKVDVLHEAESCDLADLDPADYGVIVSCGWRRGLLLPALEGVDSVDEQVSIARRKAGIGPDEAVRLERFKVDRHE